MDWSDETEARLEARLHTIPAGVSECCQPCADIRAALGEIEHFHAIHKWCHRTPTHGKCCTCQACGLDYDSCRCDLDEQVERAEAAEAKLAEAQGTLATESAERIRCRDGWAKSEAEVERLRIAGQRCMEISTGLAAAEVVGHMDILNVMSAALRGGGK